MRYALFLFVVSLLLIGCDDNLVTQFPEGQRPVRPDTGFIPDTSLYDFGDIKYKVISLPPAHEWVPGNPRKRIKNPPTKLRRAFETDLHADSTSIEWTQSDSLRFDFPDTSNYNWVYRIEDSDTWGETDSPFISGRFVPDSIYHESLFYKGDVFSPITNGYSTYDWVVILEPDSTLRWVIGYNNPPPFTTNIEVRTGIVIPKQENTFQARYWNNQGQRTIWLKVNNQESSASWFDSSPNYFNTQTSTFLGFVDDGVYRGMMRQLRIFVR